MAKIKPIHARPKALRNSPRHERDFWSNFTGVQPANQPAGERCHYLLYTLESQIV